MNVHVFVGPTLPVGVAREVLHATYHPPAAVGDIYRLAQQRPSVIALIDGAFERVPAVWHKEILWAMAQGVHVLGASSMGALRAAELAVFGMVGVGRVYTAFHNGELEDDDEVTVAHASAENGFRVGSDAMVNIRETLRMAVAQEVISEAAGSRLGTLAKATYYPERSYDRLLRDAAQAHGDSAELAQLRSWLVSERVDVKRDDALELLRLVRDRANELSQPKRVGYSFEHTHTFQQLRQHVLFEPKSSNRLDEEHEAVLDELRLLGRFAGARRAALGRVLALDEAERAGYKIEHDGLVKSAEALRRDRGLLALSDFRHWLSANGMTVAEFDRFLRDEVRVSWMESNLAVESTRMIIDHLRVTGELEGLRRTVAEKETRLAARGGSDSAVEEQTLWHWYFEGHVPADLEERARLLGFADREAFRKAARRAYLCQ